MSGSRVESLATIPDADLDAYIADLIVQKSRAQDQPLTPSAEDGTSSSNSAESRVPNTNKRFLASVIRNVEGHNKTLLRQQMADEGRTGSRKRDRSVVAAGGSGKEKRGMRSWSDDEHDDEKAAYGTGSGVKSGRNHALGTVVDETLSEAGSSRLSRPSELYHEQHFTNSRENDYDVLSPEGVGSSMLPHPTQDDDNSRPKRARVQETRNSDRQPQDDHERRSKRRKDAARREYSPQFSRIDKVSDSRHSRHSRSASRSNTDHEPTHNARSHRSHHHDEDRKPSRRREQESRAKSDRKDAHRSSRRHRSERDRKGSPSPPPPPLLPIKQMREWDRGKDLSF